MIETTYFYRRSRTDGKFVELTVTHDGIGGTPIGIHYAQAYGEPEQIYLDPRDLAGLLTMLNKLTHALQGATCDPR
ncbi:hypothetical protein [Streptomyces syringium]|uniref:hypothetical protein n=1 Tax=Streptomyces syringium TaxID=76729 RepID=UPI0033C68FB8